MTMEETLGKVAKRMDEARDNTVKAYDALAAELKGANPDADELVKHGGRMWTEGIRFWAELMLAPAAIANELRSASQAGGGGGQPGNT